MTDVDKIAKEIKNGIDDSLLCGDALTPVPRAWECRWRCSHGRRVYPVFCRSLRTRTSACARSRIYCAARDAAGIAPEGGIHTLRHAFATHLIEAGADLPTLQHLMGHGHIGTTMRYVHLARARVTGTTSPFDLLDPPTR